MNNADATYNAIANLYSDIDAICADDEGGDYFTGVERFEDSAIVRHDAGSWVIDLTVDQSAALASGRETLDGLLVDPSVYDPFESGFVVVSIDFNRPTLNDYDTAYELRNATADELAASIAAAKTDGGAGVIEVDGRSCYVVE